MIRNTSICLSHQINDDGGLTVQSRRRTEKSYNELTTGEGETITVSGWHKNLNAPHSFARAMQLYLLGRNVDPSLIFLEEYSLDTVGQAIFTKLNILVPRNWERLSVVTDDDHLSRAMAIFDFIYGKHFDITTPEADTAWQEGVISKERELLYTFYKTFRGVK